MIRILDTNVLLDREINEIIESFPGCEIVIPLAVLQELNNFKGLDDNRGKNSRLAIRFLDELRASGKLHQGIQLENGSNLRIEINHNDVSLPPVFNAQLTDNRILAVAKGLSLKSSDTKIITQMGQEIYGHVTLNKSERSMLAELAVNLL